MIIVKFNELTALLDVFLQSFITVLPNCTHSLCIFLTIFLTYTPYVGAALRRSFHHNSRKFSVHSLCNLLNNAVMQLTCKFSSQLNYFLCIFCMSSTEQFLSVDAVQSCSFHSDFDRNFLTFTAYSPCIFSEHFLAL